MRNKRVLFVLVIFLGSITLLPLAGRFLVVTDSPTKSDAIIVLTGGGVERYKKAVALYQAGLAPVIIVSNAMEDDIYDAAIQSGVPEKNIIKETKADSTYTNALYTLAIMKKHNLKSALVVSSDYHMRRVKFNFDSIFRNSDIRLTYCSAQTDYSSSLWFMKKNYIKITINEYIKIVGNAIGFNGNDDKEILNKIYHLISNTTN